MKLGHFLVLLSSVIWLLPLFKQKGTQYFYYFLSLALADPFVEGVKSIIKINPSILVLFILTFQIAYLLKEKKFLINFIYFLPITLAIVLIFNSKLEMNIAITTYFLFLIVVIVLKFAAYVQKNMLNLFLIILLFYNVLNLLKFLALVLSVKQGYFNFIIGYSFQILCGISFAFININTKNFKMKLNS